MFRGDTTRVGQEVSFLWSEYSRTVWFLRRGFHGKRGSEEVEVQGCSEGMDNSMLVVECSSTLGNRHQSSVLTTLIVGSVQSSFKAVVGKNLR